MAPAWSISVTPVVDGWSWSATRDGIVVASGWYRGGTRELAERFARRTAQEHYGARLLEAA